MINLKKGDIVYIKKDWEHVAGKERVVLKDFNPNINNAVIVEDAFVGLTEIRYATILSVSIDWEMTILSNNIKLDNSDKENYKNLLTL